MHKNFKHLYSVIRTNTGISKPKPKTLSHDADFRPISTACVIPSTLLKNEVYRKLKGGEDSTKSPGVMPPNPESKSCLN